MLTLIAYLTMFADHVGRTFFPDAIAWTLVGRIAMPIFCFMTAQGMRYTRSAPKYMLRLFIVAIISQIPFAMLFGSYLNVCFTLLLGAAVIWTINSERLILPLKICLGIVILLLTYFVHFDYGLYAVIIIVFYYLMLGSDLAYSKIVPIMIVCHFVITWLFDILKSWPQFELLSVFGLILALAATGLHIPDIRLPHRLNYAIYPAHLIIILIIAAELGISIR